MSSWSTSGGQLKNAAAAAAILVLAPSEGLNGRNWVWADTTKANGGAWAGADPGGWAKAGQRAGVKSEAGSLPPLSIARQKQQEKQFVGERANLSWYRKVVYGGGKQITITPTKTTTTTNEKSGHKQQQGQAKRINSRKQRQRNSIIAHASSNFVDKLTYMIKKSNSSARNESDFVAGTGGDGTGSGKIDPATGNLQPQQLQSVNKSFTATTATKATVEPSKAGNGDHGSASSGSGSGSGNGSSSGSGTGTGNRYLLSELSRRLVKRCTKSKAVQFATRASGATGGGSKSKSASASTNTMAAAASSPPAAGGEQKSSSSSSRAEQKTQSHIHQSQRTIGETKATSGGSVKGSFWGSKGGSSSSMATATVTEPRPLASKAACSQQLPQVNQQQQQKQQQSSAGVATAAAAAATASNLTHQSNLNSSSISTLSTATVATPSGCCFCDEGSSSGFVSSGINCSDSINTHSCSSSTYNDPVADQQPAAHQVQVTGSGCSSSSGVPDSPVLKSATITSSAVTRSGSLMKGISVVQQHKRNHNHQPQQQQQHDHHRETVVMEQPRPQQLTLEVSKSEPTGASESGGSGKSGSPSSSSKKKGSSFLSRARNSTINLASLANVTQRFNCSASVGNLWAHGGSTGQASEQKRELAELSGDSSVGGVKPLDYSARGPFDGYDHNNNNSATAPIIAGSDSKQLQLPQTLASASSSRKSSTKEKKKRQKEAEKVEKLRLLVNYLKSGTSQQLINPVKLEDDEIELAQKYKSQLILCDECLAAGDQPVACGGSGASGGCGGGLSTGAASSASIPASASNGRLAGGGTLSGSRSPDASSSIQLDLPHNYELDGYGLMFHHHLNHHHHHNNQLNSEQEQGSLFKETNGGELSPPDFLTSCRSMPCGDGVISSSNSVTDDRDRDRNQRQQGREGGRDGRSTGAEGCASRTRKQCSNPPHISNVPWGMRHSVSDPGSSFERAQRDAQGQFMTAGSGAASSGGEGGDGTASVAGAASCSYAGSSSSAQLSRRLRNFGQSSQHQQSKASSSAVQSPKSMFYIDEMERKDSDSSDTNSQLLVNTHHSHMYTNQTSNRHHHHHHYGCDEQSRRSGSKATISSSEAIRDLPTRSWSSELFLSSTPNAATTNNTVSGNNATGVPTTTNTKNNLPTVTLTSMTSTFNSSSNTNNYNNNNNVSSSNNNNSNTSTQTNASSNNPVSPAASSSRTSAWTNPQTLATWIDNEVNSLVNDLEAKSQLVKSEKHVKRSKRKWLSSSSRRNSSGAHST